MNIWNKKWVDSNVDRNKEIIIPKSMKIINKNEQDDSNEQDENIRNFDDTKQNENINNSYDAEQDENDVMMVSKMPSVDESNKEFDKLVEKLEKEVEINQITNLKEEYNTGNLLPRTRKKSKAIPCFEVTSTAMIVYKDPLYKKFFNKIKSFFKLG